MKTSFQCIKNQYMIVGVEATHNVEEPLAQSEQALENRTSDHFERTENFRISLRSWPKDLPE